MSKKSITTKVIALGIAMAFSTAFTMPDSDKPSTEIFAASDFKVDPVKSTLKWTASKVGGEHTGTVKLEGGSLSLDGKNIKEGSFVIDMSTIEDTDITNASMNEKLVGHLKSDDFFSVEKHRTATFKITKVESIAKAKSGEANYNITGDLAIKGITNKVTFPAVVNVSGNTAQAIAKIEIDRTKWDIKYRSGLLGTAADKIIHDNFTIDLNLVANKEIAIN